MRDFYHLRLFLSFILFTVSCSDGKNGNKLEFREQSNNLITVPNEGNSTSNALSNSQNVASQGKALSSAGSISKEDFLSCVPTLNLSQNAYSCLEKKG